MKEAYFYQTKGIRDEILNIFSTDLLQIEVYHGKLIPCCKASKPVLEPRDISALSVEDYLHHCGMSGNVSNIIQCYLQMCYVRENVKCECEIHYTIERLS